MKKINKYIFLVFTLMLGLISCEDLEIENKNEPDTERVLSSAEDVINLLQGSFLSYWQATRQTNIQITSLIAADQFTCSWGNFYMRWASNEPRLPWDNTVTAANDQVSENFWINGYAALSQVNDVIRVVNAGMDLGAEKDAILSFGYFMQGWIIGNMGLAFDKAFVVTENTDLSSIEFLEYQAVMDSAVASLEKAIDIATNAASFELEGSTINGVTVNNALVVSLSHSYIARFLALTPRNASQNASVDWQKVLDNATLGIQSDFGPTGTGSPYEDAQWYDENFIYLVKPGWARIRNRIINLMDPDYPKEYWANGVAQVVHAGMEPGQASSDDARLLSDFAYLPSVDFRPERGYYHFSNYRYKRFDTDMYLGFGMLHEFRAYENKLYIAEAQAMLNNLPAALAILNDNTLPRNARGQLADLPNNASQADIMEAIFYERDVELISQGFMIGFYDMRRRDMLQTGTYLHYPVPGKELETLGLPVYTFGGVNNADGINTSNGGWF